MTDDSSEEAAWRDLVAQYATPGAADGTPAPWPTREDLPGPGAPGEEAAGLDRAGPDVAGPDDPGAGAGQQPGPGRPAIPGQFSGINPGPPQIRIVRPASPAPPPGD